MSTGFMPLLCCFTNGTDYFHVHTLLRQVRLQFIQIIDLFVVGAVEGAFYFLLVALTEVSPSFFVLEC